MKLYKTIFFENQKYYLAEEVDKEDKNYCDKISRRNRQIEDLRTKSAEDEAIYENLDTKYNQVLIDLKEQRIDIKNLERVVALLRFKTGEIKFGEFHDALEKTGSRELTEDEHKRLFTKNEGRL